MKKPVIQHNAPLITNTYLTLAVSFLFFVAGFAFIVLPFSFRDPVFRQPYQDQRDMTTVENKFEIFEIDSLDILETYENFSEINIVLNQDFAIHRGSSNVVTGKDLIDVLLHIYDYNPTLALDEKNDSIQNFKNDYTFLISDLQLSFVINTANVLYTETYNLYPWSIQEYTKEDIHRLLVYPYYYPFLYDLFPTDVENVALHDYNDTIVVDAHYKQYDIAKKIVGNAKTHKNAISKLIQWTQKNFVHAADDYGWDIYKDDSWDVPLPQTIEDIYSERVIGCHEPTVMLVGMLHNMNIPAVRLSVHGHGLIYLPSVDGYVHGDHIASSLYTPGTPWLFSLEELISYNNIEDALVSWKTGVDMFHEKYDIPLYMYLARDEDDLKILGSLDIDTTDGSCNIPLKYIWMSARFAVFEYNMLYDKEDCNISSNLVPIKTIDNI